MKNTLALVIALFICSNAFCSDKKPCDGDNEKNKSKQTADTPATKKQTAKNNPVPVIKDNTQKPRKEPASTEGGFIAPLSWRPVLVY